MSNPDKEIVVLGAGIAGLATAVLLARSGRCVTVFEQRSKIGGRGAGIQITSNGTKVIKALGISPDLSTAVCRSAAVCRAKDGGVLFEHRLEQYAENGTPHLLLHRQDFLKHLYELAAAEKIGFIFGKRAVSVDNASHAAICRFSDGSKLSASYVIGADGIYSAARRSICGPRRMFSDYIAWRALVPLDKIQGRFAGKTVNLIIGSGRHVVYYPLKDRMLMNVVAVERLKAPKPMQPPMTVPPDSMGKAFSEFGGMVSELMKLCQHVSLWHLPRPDLAEKWSNERSVIIGDALHPMPPFLAQGGNMALEDAWILSRAINETRDLPAAHERFERERKHRIKRILKAVAIQGRLYHISGSPFTTLRDRFLSIGSILAPSVISHTLRWIFDADVTADRAR